MSVSEQLRRLASCPLLAGSPTAPVLPWPGFHVAPEIEELSRLGCFHRCYLAGALSADAAARVDAAAIWGVPEVPETPGRDVAGMLAAIEGGELSALVAGGVRIDDLPAEAEAALRAVEFLVVLDTHAHELVELADVVFPVAAAPEKAGTFLNWEGRARPSSRALRTNLMSDARVLASLAAELDVAGLGSDPATLRAQFGEFAGWEGARVGSPDVRCRRRCRAAPGCCWPLGVRFWSPRVLQGGEPYLAATARGRRGLVVGF